MKSIALASVFALMSLHATTCREDIQKCEIKSQCPEGKTCDFELHLCVHPRPVGAPCSNHGQCETQQCIVTADSNGQKRCD